jgi:hypothetical protein
MKNATSSNLFSVDRPNDHDIEAVRPHMRKHLRPFKLLIQGSEVTINGTNPADAKKRFKAMTGGGVAFVFPRRAGKTFLSHSLKEKR